MRVDMRQGLVSHQAGGFLHINTAGNVDLLANNRPVVVAIAHHHTDYLHSDDTTVVDAWVGPFAGNVEHWLYWEFSQDRFLRSYGYTSLEPVAQSMPPGSTGVDIVGVVTGSNNHAKFIVNGQYTLQPNRPIAVADSTANDGMYTIVYAVYDGSTGLTSLTVAEPITDTTVDGNVSLDLDRSGIPLRTEGRMWYDTNDHIHYELQAGSWVQVLRVFAAKMLNRVFTSASIYGHNTFTGTQIGDTNTTMIGRVLFTENANIIIRDDNTFLTTEDQFFTNQSRVDALRLESNVARGSSVESAIAAFTVVAWVGEGEVGTAQYNHTGTAVVGMLTEDVLLHEVGAVIIQGVITNPEWNWTSGPNAVPVGSALWVENGELVSINPHTVDVLTYGTPRVPVARVLNVDTIIFEQGLGGVGDQGPPGSLTDLPVADTIHLGAVTLITPSSDPQRGLVVSDTDPRLTDSRIPSPHTHPAQDVLVTPSGTLTSANAQLAFQELDQEKVNVGGDTMTGPLTLYGNPSTPLHAATKQYVDGLVSGLVWLDPIRLVNMISTSIAVPPITPTPSDAYILPSGAIGAWSGIPGGNIVLWDGDAWVDLGPLTAMGPDLRLGISMQSPTTSSGSFTGHEGHIALYDATGNLTGFEIPTTNNAVYVNFESSLHAFDQFAFDGDKWILFGGAAAISVDDATTVMSTNVLSVKQYADGGVNDVKFWQGLEPADLALTYSVLSHSHMGVDIGVDAYATSPNWGTPTTISNTEITSVHVQGALEKLVDTKASKRPTYLTIADAPTAGSVEGMVIHVRDENMLFYADGSSWVPVAVNGGPISIPYDIAFSIIGALQQNTLMGIYSVSRSLVVNDPSLSIAITTEIAADISSDLILRKVDGVTHVISDVGTITFAAGSLTGVIVIPSTISLVRGDSVQLWTDPANAADPTLGGIGITIVACATTDQCSIA